MGKKSLYRGAERGEKQIKVQSLLEGFQRIDDPSFAVADVTPSEPNEHPCPVPPDGRHRAPSFGCQGWVCQEIPEPKPIAMRLRVPGRFLGRVAVDDQVRVDGPLAGIVRDGYRGTAGVTKNPHEARIRVAFQEVYDRQIRTQLAQHGPQLAVVFRLVGDRNRHLSQPPDYKGTRPIGKRAQKSRLERYPRLHGFHKINAALQVTESDLRRGIAPIDHETRTALVTQGHPTKGCVGTEHRAATACLSRDQHTSD